MKFGSLFAGIGGFDLGLERAGLSCAWQVEKDSYARAVLAHHWPNVKRYDDVCTVGGSNLAPVELICGGFPCQDISIGGQRAGLEGRRSGLWFEFARIIGELRPSFVLIENVAHLRRNGLHTVLRDLAGCGYDAEWTTIPASSFGFPHERARLFVIAYPASVRLGGGTFFSGFDFAAAARRTQQALASADEATVHIPALGRAYPRLPGIVRGPDGLPARLRDEALRMLGNAIVPAVAEAIGRCIIGRD